MHVRPERSTNELARMRDVGELIVGDAPRPGEVVIGVWKNQSSKVSSALFFVLFFLLNPALTSLSFLTLFLCGLSKCFRMGISVGGAVGGG